MNLAIFIALILGIMSAQDTAMKVKHPVMRFSRDSSGFQSGYEEICRASDEQLRKMYLDEMTEETVVPRNHNRRVYAAMGLWESTGEGKARKAAIRACRAMLGDIIDASDKELREAMDDDKGFSRRSRIARDAAYHFALLYRLTDEQTFAHKSAVMLARFAEVMPNWPIQSPHFGPLEDRKLLPRDWPDYHKTDRVNGIWGGWIYGAATNGNPLAYAYDLIHGSGKLQQMGKLEAVEKELNWSIEFMLGYGREMGNMDCSTMRGIIDIARILGRTEVVHHCIQWIRDLYRTGFYADGWWHEGTPSYHQQIHGNMQEVIRNYLQGYTDPPGYKSVKGVRYDNLDLMAELKRPIERAQSVLDNIHQPNGNYQCIHDTTFPQVNWEKIYIKQAKSFLWGCMGHAILGTGSGDNMVQATLHFSGTHGHAHHDTLNFMLFAKGKELISETRYRPMAGSKSTREWHTMTAGHATVVIDEKDQSVTTRREQQPSDAIPGIADGKYRWGGHGDHMVEGRLRIHSTDFEKVQVVEADGERAYHETKNDGIYRRTIALVKISESDTYAVDVFRVRGGKTHDYMLHGCLDEPYTAELSVALKNELPGTLHKYISSLRSGRTDDNWTATFNLKSGEAGLKTFFLRQPGTQIIRGNAPAMRCIGEAPFLCIRQIDGDSIYAAVHHPFKEEPLVRDVKLIESSMDSVALKVFLPDRVDTIKSTAKGFTHQADGQWSYEVGGSHTLTGVVTSTFRIDAGDDFDAFVTDTQLPADGSLNGFTIMIDIGGLLVQSFTIDRIDRRGNQTIIHSRNEPGMTIEPNLVKLNYFPCWGIAGKAKFRINGSRLKEE